MATKLTVRQAPTPSEEIVQDANRIAVVHDARGRAIGVKKPNMSIRRRVYKALSDESAKKQQYLGLVMVAACVVEIDGDPVSPPTTELQFDALLDRLEEEGFEAAGMALQKEFGIGANLNELAIDAGE
jgi:hypothetical protein